MGRRLKPIGSHTLTHNQNNINEICPNVHFEIKFSCVISLPVHLIRIVQRDQFNSKS